MSADEPYMPTTNVPLTSAPISVDVLHGTKSSGGVNPTLTHVLHSLSGTLSFFLLGDQKTHTL